MAFPQRVREHDEARRARTDRQVPASAPCQGNERGVRRDEQHHSQCDKPCARGEPVKASGHTAGAAST